MSEKIPITVDVRNGRQKAIYRARFSSVVEVRGSEEEAEECALRAANGLSDKFFSDIRNEGRRLSEAMKKLFINNPAELLIANQEVIQALRDLARRLEHYNEGYTITNLKIKANENIRPKRNP